MADRARVFIDFWNFQLNWNNRAKGKCDYSKLPKILLEKAKATLISGGVHSELQLDGTTIYASYNPTVGKDRSLRGWLEDTVGKFPGVRVNIKERTPKTKTIHCRACGGMIEFCPHCSVEIKSAPEKGIDGAIITDMFSLAWEHAYDIAILVTSDKDMKPAVERLQDKGVKVVNFTWKGSGHDLAKACWASCELDTFVGELVA